MALGVVVLLSPFQDLIDGVHFYKKEEKSSGVLVYFVFHDTPSLQLVFLPVPTVPKVQGHQLHAAASGKYKTIFKWEII